jgi:transposase
MAIKGQKFKHYPESLKVKAIQLHMEEGWSYRQVTEYLQIHDMGRVKKWMSQFRKKGWAAFEDKRGNPSREETEQNRELRRLQLEVDVLKKWLHIMDREGRRSNIKSSMN